jgi:hypothetical protein
MDLSLRPIGEADISAQVIPRLFSNSFVNPQRFDMPNRQLNFLSPQIKSPADFQRGTIFI